MYSYPERSREVEFYIKLGKRIKTTIRQLGYPTKNALKAWCREYEQARDLRVRWAARAPKYSEAEKQAAVERYRTHDRCIASTMRALGYPGRALFDGLDSRGVSRVQCAIGGAILASCRRDQSCAG